jgi:hypothetical protein
MASETDVIAVVRPTFQLISTPCSPTPPTAAHRLRPPILQGLALALVLFVGGCDESPAPTIPGGAEEGDIVAIGGKTIGRSPDAAKGIGPVHRVNAWASEAGIALGELATGKKPNEITAITVLLKQEKVEKVGIKTNRKMCGWDHGYLLTVTGLRDHPQTV